MARLILAIMMAVFAQTATFVTLREVLQKNSIALPLQGIINLEQGVTSFEFENSSDLFWIAYYERDVTQRLPDAVQILTFDKKTKRWAHGVYPHGIGSILDARHTAKRLYIQGHSSPSASDTVVLDRNFTPVTVISGSILQLLPDDVAYYEHSMVHFAPIHQAEVWIYDAKSGLDRRLYPNEPYQPVWKAYSETVRKIYDGIDSDRLRDLNFSGDPRSFDVNYDRNTLISDNSADGRVAFVAKFGGPLGIPTPIEDVLVVCKGTRKSSPRCSEQLMTSARGGHPSLTDPQILTDAMRHKN